MKKALFSLLMCIALVLSLLPAGVPVFAFEYPAKPVSQQSAVKQGIDYKITELEDEDPPVFQIVQPLLFSIPNATVKTEEEAALLVRQHMKDRTEKFWITLQTNNLDSQAIMERVLEKALEHTGDPEEGDYLLWQYGGCTFTAVEQYTWTRHVLFKVEMAYYTTAEQEQEVSTAIDQLLAQLNTSGMDDYQKVCAVYDYICNNITYDYTNLNNNSYLLKHTAYGALINKTAVCQGYAVLLYRLLQELGVDNRVITGTSSGQNHARNIVKLNGLYYNVDSTWDAETLDKRFFLKCTDNFADHSRFVEYCSLDFHNRFPMSSTDYVPGAAGQAEKIVARGKAGDNISWSISTDGELTVTGSGAIRDYPYSAVLEQLSPWEIWEKEIKKLVVGEGITRIGEYNFCDFEAVSSISLPSTLWEIGSGAFCHTGGPVDIVIPNGVTTLASSAFSKSTGIRNIAIPDSVTQMGVACFAECTNLETVVLGQGLTEISNSVFGDCPKLKSITIPDTVTKIGESAFDDCVSLKKVVIPASVTEIGRGAFSYCCGLEEVVFEGKTNLGSDVFSSNESALRVIRFCKDAPEFNARSFSGITAACYYPADNATWTAEVMQQYGGNITWVAQSCLSGHKEAVIAGAKASCTTPGLSEGRRCSVCGEVLVAQQTIPATGHSFGDWAKVKPATTAETGLAERTCTACGKKEQKQLEKLEPEPTQPTTVPTTNPTEPTTQPTEPTTKPTTSPTTEPTEPATQPSTAPSTKPTQPQTQPTTQPQTQLTTRPVTQPEGTSDAGTADRTPGNEQDSPAVVWVIVGLTAAAAVAAGGFIAFRKFRKK
ncbi:MAG: leucine-rich repeat protein [Oscillospiraceae bacterium]|nr:leucine-rich repeat protein [Oscillospiraceae bacterium]